MQIDTPTRRYSAWVRAPNQQEIQIANNYAFRTEQAGANSISYLSIQSGAGTHTVCNVQINSLTTQTPIEGDVNSDRIVNILDIQEIVAHFAKTKGYPANVNLAAPALIDLFDAMVVVRNWGRTQ